MKLKQLSFVVLTEGKVVRILLNLLSRCIKQIMNVFYSCNELKLKMFHSTPLLTLKENYEIVGESRPLSAFFPKHDDFFTEKVSERFEP